VVEQAFPQPTRPSKCRCISIWTTSHLTNATLYLFLRLSPCCTLPNNAATCNLEDGDEMDNCGLAPILVRPFWTSCNRSLLPSSMGPELVKFARRTTLRRPPWVSIMKQRRRHDSTLHSISTGYAHLKELDDMKAPHYYVTVLLHYCRIR
jgi:hypothetical protein